MGDDDDIMLLADISDDNELGNGGAPRGTRT
jgi:hypothetical protein